ncbi:MAG: glycosyltransferase family 39 protein [Clostridiales bacterium]|jgi:4-amino-4-deoxy-L-arabinose transferase-like glycosyltransferase|nr:glycosyltransferase family 39 protein [Eubacteriales bacterium]MDH7567083.1 glycosyltransferase family 39 protein [Clostridiales bacterium]
MNIISKKPSSFWEVSLITGILIFAFSLRLYYLFKIPHPPLIFDAANYDAMAKQFLEKGFLGYASSKPNAFTTPGYPLFLALIYKIFGYSNGSPLTQVRIIQVALSTLTIGFLYLLGKQVSNGRTGLIAAFFSSIYLISLWVPTLILTETLYTFLFVLYLYLQVTAIKTRSGFLNFLTGAVLAAAVLVRPAVAPLIILPYVYYYMETRDRTLIKNFLLNVCGFVLLMLPWWIRNVVTLKKLILFATQEDPLLKGTYPYEEGIENAPLINQKQEAIRRLKEGFTTRPLYYLKWYTIGKFDFIFFKTFYYVDEKVTTLRWLLPLHQFFVWFGWVGVFLSSVRKEIKLIALYVFLLTLIQLVFVATSRYSYPIMQLLILLSAYIIDILFFRTRQAD